MTNFKVEFSKVSYLLFGILFRTKLNSELKMLTCFALISYNVLVIQSLIQFKHYCGNHIIRLMWFFRMFMLITLNYIIRNRINTQTIHDYAFTSNKPHHTKTECQHKTHGLALVERRLHLYINIEIS